MMGNIGPHVPDVTHHFKLVSSIPGITAAYLSVCQPEVIPITIMSMKIFKILPLKTPLLSGVSFIPDHDNV